LTTRTNLDGSRRALFSDCRGYRYELQITWKDGPLLVMACLNPSTADEMQNDPTVQRQCERADRLGFGSFLMLNAFAIRSTYPSVMLTANDPYGEWRDAECLVDSYRRNNGAMLIAAWGAHAKHRGRHYELVEAFAKAGIAMYYLVKTKHGYPSHPLYIGYDTQPIPWSTANSA